MFVTKQKIHDIIFEADTRLGKLFDIALIILILLSVITVMLETVSDLKLRYSNWFITLEWIFTGLFTLEYILRIYVLKKPIKYILSTYGIIDLIAIIPLYLTFFASGAQVLMNFRILRLLRIFRVLKLVKFIGEANTLKKALRASRNKIAIFLYTIIILCVIIGTVMYLIEGGAGGFTSIPTSIYWTIVTLTTVGYGDIAPTTAIGQLLASITMILGYGIIAVPTGIVTSEMTKQYPSVASNTQHCTFCGNENHQDKAQFCHACGNSLHEKS